MKNAFITVSAMLAVIVIVMYFVIDDSPRLRRQYYDDCVFLTKDYDKCVDKAFIKYPTDQEKKFNKRVHHDYTELGILIG